MRLATQVAALKRRPALVATVLLATVAHAGALLLFDVAPPPPPPPTPPAPFMHMARREGPSDVLRDQALLLDSAPLFLPTPWSTAPAVQESVETLPDPNLFEAFPDEVTLAVENMRPNGPVAGPTQRIDILQYGALDPVTGLGQGQDDVRPLPARSASFEIRRMESGSLVASGDINGAAALTQAPLLWQPAQFLVRVTPEGVMGLPLMAQGSGSDAIDDVLRGLVAASPRLDSLPPGYYSVTVGP